MSGFESFADIIARTGAGKTLIAHKVAMNAMYGKYVVAYPAELVAEFREDDRQRASAARRGASIMRSVAYRSMATSARRSATAVGQYIRDVHAFTPEPTLRTTERIGLR